MNTRVANRKSSNLVKVNLWVDLVVFTVIMLALSPGFIGLSLPEWLGIAL